MITVVLIGGVITLLVGVGFKWYADNHAGNHWYDRRKVTWMEFMVVSAAAVLLVLPLAGFVGQRVSVHSQVSGFMEYLNGKEVDTRAVRTECSRDGACAHQYDCDPYQVSYSCNCSTDSNGYESCDTCYRTKYHSCPYATEEWAYHVDTSLGTFTIDRNRFAETPIRWRRGKAIPQRVIDRAGLGAPQFWTDALQRIRRGQPGPVTRQSEYANYVYASDQTILSAYSEDVTLFDGQGLFPAFTSQVHSYYHADKAYFIGVRPDPRWRAAVSYFNAEFARREGDLHVVLVNNPTVSANPDRYANALKAFWQDRERWDRWAFPKNALALIVGTEDGQTVSFIRAFTGMPVGNEALLQRVRGLSGMPFGPEILGRSGSAYGAHYEADTVANLERALLVDGDSRFRRVSMAGDRADGAGGFLYLKSDVRPTPLAIAVTLLIAMIMTTGLWVVSLQLDLDPTD